MNIQILYRTQRQVNRKEVIFTEDLIRITLVLHGTVLHLPARVSRPLQKKRCNPPWRTASNRVIEEGERGLFSVSQDEHTDSTHREQKSHHRRGCQRDHGLGGGHGRFGRSKQERSTGKEQGQEKQSDHSFHLPRPPVVKRYSTTATGIQCSPENLWRGDLWFGSKRPTAATTSPRAPAQGLDVKRDCMLGFQDVKNNN